MRPVLVVQNDCIIDKAHLNKELALQVGNGLTGLISVLTEIKSRLVE